MNSIEALAKERGGAIEALSLIGISTSWIGALAAHPTLFKQYLREHKRNSARVVHPEPNQTDLSKKAGDIYPAFDLLEQIDEETLTKAMREFADKFSVPRIEVINAISSLKTQKDAVTRDLLELRTLQTGYRKELAAKRSTIDATLALEMLQLQFSLPKDIDPNAKQIRLQDMRNCLFYTPIMLTESPETPDTIMGSSYLCYISPNGKLYVEDIEVQCRKKTTTTAEIKKKVIKAIHIRSAKVRPTHVGFSTDAGHVIGLINSEYAMITGLTDNKQLPDVVENPEKMLTVTADSKEFLLSCRDSLVSAGAFYGTEKISLHNTDTFISFIGVVSLDKLAENSTNITAYVFYIEDFIPLT